MLSVRTWTLQGILDPALFVTWPTWYPTLRCHWTKTFLYKLALVSSLGDSPPEMTMKSTSEALNDTVHSLNYPNSCHRHLELTNGLPSTVSRICLGTPEKVNKWLKGALMASQLRHNFQASQAVHGADDVSTPPFLEPGQFNRHLCSPSWKSNFLQRAGVPNLIRLTLISRMCPSWFKASSIPWRITTSTSTSRRSGRCRPTRPRSRSWSSEARWRSTSSSGSWNPSQRISRINIRSLPEWPSTSERQEPI